MKAAKIWSDLWLARLEQLRVFFLSLCISLFHVSALDLAALLAGKSKAARFCS